MNSWIKTNFQFYLFLFGLKKIKKMSVWIVDRYPSLLNELNIKCVTFCNRRVVTKRNLI